MDFFKVLMTAQKQSDHQTDDFDSQGRKLTKLEKKKRKMGKPIPPRKSKEPKEPKEPKQKKRRKNKYIDDECGEECGEEGEEGEDIEFSDGVEEMEDDETNHYELDDGFIVDDISSKEAQDKSDQLIDEEFAQADKELAEAEEALSKKRKQKLDARKLKQKEKLKQEILEELKRQQPEQVEQEQEEEIGGAEKEKEKAKEKAKEELTAESEFVGGISVAILGPSDCNLALKQSSEWTQESFQKALAMATYWIAKKWQLPVDDIEILSGTLGTADHIAAQLWYKPCELLGVHQRYKRFRFVSASRLEITDRIFKYPQVLAQDSGIGDFNMNPGRMYNLTHTHLTKKLHLPESKTSQWPVLLLNPESNINEIKHAQWFGSGITKQGVVAELDCLDDWHAFQKAILSRSTHRIVFLPRPLKPEQSTDPVWSQNISQDQLKIFYI